MTTPLQPAAIPASAMRAVRGRFLAAGWTERASADRLGIPNLDALGCAPPLGTRARDSIGLLCRVFLLDEAVPRDALAAVIGVRGMDRLERMNLLEIEGKSVRSPLNLFPCGGLYLTTDKRGFHPAFNQVMWLYPECWQLARLAVRRPSERALDLCTGSGIHALLARRFADQVVGIDTNPRAIAFAEHNRAFNGIDRVEFVHGDLYQPLDALRASERRFGAVFANPPYHPVLDSKPGENAYSGGETGEEILRKIVRGLGQHLGPGGCCQIITLFIHREGANWRQKLRRWLGGTGYEVVLLSSPVAYPSSLQHELVRLGRYRAEDLVRSFKAQRITGFSFGLLTIRRASGRGRHVEGPYGPES